MTLTGTMNAFEKLRHFAGHAQIAAIRQGLKGEESEHFEAKLAEYTGRVLTMPKVYEQDGLGENAIVHLHYFRGNQDWYITERDTTDQQFQAFGFANLGCGAELGYINIAELIAHGVEMDLHWTPRTVKESGL